MFKAALWSVLGLTIGMVSSVANAQFIYSPGGYYGAPIVRSYYSAPVPVGISYYAPVPVVISRPVYAPVVQSYYSAPTPVYSTGISTASYSTDLEPTPIYSQPAPTYYQPTQTYYQPAPTYVAPAPVYVTAAPVIVTRSMYSPAVYESLTVRPFSTTYRASGYGWGAPSIYARSNGHRTVIRTRGW